MIAGINMVRMLNGEPLLEFPRTSMIGALLYYITHADPTNFQPMKANMGLLPEFAEWIKGKPNRYAAYAERAKVDMEAYLNEVAFEVTE